MSKPTLLNWISLIALGFIWGASFMGAKIALSGFGPITVATLRLGIGALVLIGVMLAMGHRFPTMTTPNGKRLWLHILGMGILTNALPFSLLNWGQLYVTSSFAGITMSVVPLLVLPLAHFLLGDLMNTRKVVGFVVGFIGVVILIGPAEILRPGGSALPQLACVAAACCYGLSSLNTRLCPPIPTIVYSGAGLLLGFLIILPLALWAEGWPTDPIPAQAWAGVVYLGLLPTALATLLLVGVINSAGPTFMSLVNYQVPFWAVVLGVVILSEPFPPQFAGALILILLGLAISQGRFFKTQKPQK